MTKLVSGIIGIVCVTISLVFIITTSFKRIDPGYAGILIDYASGSNGKPSITSLSLGEYTYVGIFSGKKLVEYPVAEQSLVLSANQSEGEIPGNSSMSCQTSGGGILHFNFSINWGVNPQHPEILYLKRPDVPLTSDFNNDINTLVVYNAVKDAFNAVCPIYTWQDLLGDGTSTPKNGAFKAAILSTLQTSLGTDGIVVSQIFVDQPVPDATIQKVLDAHNAAEQSSYLKEQAQNEAAASVAKAQGDAQAIAILNEQLSKSPTYIQYLTITRWDGKLPSTLVTDGKTNPVLTALPSN